MVVSISILLTLGVFLTAIAYIAVQYLRNIRLYRAAANIPGPPTLPFIGNAHNFLMGNNADILSYVQKIVDTYPSPSRLWLANKLYVVIYEPEQLKAVLKTVERNEFIEMVSTCLGVGLLTQPVSIWRTRRKMIVPTFHPRILESFSKVFSTQAEIMVKVLEREVNGGEFDVFDYFSRSSLDIICETVMGIPSTLQTQKEVPFIKALERITQILSMRLFKFWLHPDIIFYNTQLGKEQREHVKYVQDFIGDVVKRKKQALEGKVEGLDKLPAIEGERKVFLEMLMKHDAEDGTKLTEEELRDEVSSMVSAGHETSATTESFAMLALATHPEIQEKVYKELCEIYGSEDPGSIPIKQEDLPRMKYLERVIKETLRFFPVVPFHFRVLTEDLDIGPCTLPKGSSILIGILKTHRSEEYWTDPLTFNPDRFLPEESAKRHPYAFMPFSHGPRNCVGMTFAMMSMKTVLAAIIRNYVIKKDNPKPLRDVKFKFEIALKPVDPITVKLERRIHKKK